MHKSFYDNIIAFVFGDLSATIMLVVLKVDWLLTIEQLTAKLLIVILSGFVGGAAGVVGKYCMKKFLDKNYNIIIGSCLLAVVTGSGCKSQLIGTVRQASAETKDSASVQIIERLVPVYLPGDTVWFEHAIECPDLPQAANNPAPKPKPFKATVSGKRSSGVIEVNDVGRLSAIFNCNGLRDSVKVRDTEIERLQSVLKTETTVQTVQVKYIPKAYKAAMWFSCIVIVLVAGRIALKVALNYFKIQIPFLSWLIK